MNIFHFRKGTENANLLEIEAGAACFININIQIRRSRPAVAWCSLIVTRSWSRPWPWPAWPSRCTRSSPSRWLWGGPGHPQAPRTHFHRPRAPQRPCAVGAQPFGLDFEPLLGRRRAKAQRTMLYYGVLSLSMTSSMPIQHHSLTYTSATPELGCANEHAHKPFKGPFYRADCL